MLAWDTCTLDTSHPPLLVNDIEINLSIKASIIYFTSSFRSSPFIYILSWPGNFVFSYI